jgi:hypothetical protein
VRGETGRQQHPGVVDDVVVQQRVVAAHHPDHDRGGQLRARCSQQRGPAATAGQADAAGAVGGVGAGAQVAQSDAVLVRDDGGKGGAEQVAVLLEHGFVVPRGCVVSSDVFRHLTGN